jgi:hypothetical protein
MKTLTELGGSLIRTAAAAVAEAKRSLPREPPPAAAEVPVQAEPVATPATPPTEATPPAEVQVAVEAETSEGAPSPAPTAEAAAPAAPAESRKPARKEPVEEVESEAVKAALDAAVERATGVSGDRLARLRDAVKVVGGRIKDVRLVRVFGVEEPVAGAKAIGSFQYVVDISPSNMTQSFARPEKDRGGRGGRGGGGGGRGAGSGGGKAGATGGFSMDSLKEDRKGGRPGGGRPGGGGRKPGGGGKPGGP